MILTCEKLRSLIVGAIGCEQKEDGLHFYKYTEKQLAFFRSLDAGFAERAETTTGIRFDFHTDARSITVKCAGGKTEVLVDGLLRHRHMEEGMAVFSVALDSVTGEEEKDHRVTLVLPSHGKGIVESVSLEGASYASPHAFDKKILFVGDSITQGWDSEIDSLSFAYRVSLHYNAESVIQGTGGAYFHEDSFDSLPFDPDMLIVALGTNDFGHYDTPDEMASHADAHLTLLAKEYASKPRYYVSPIWRASQSARMGSFAECRAVLTALAEKHGFTHIDGLALVPPASFFYCPDNLHPNTLGFSLYSENLIRFLENTKKA